MVYFTSDTHFFHKNIINLCDRPFNSLEHMHQILIYNWNKTVNPNDDVYILGDFAFNRAGSGEEVNEILKKLNGKKYLVRGNHDKFIKDPDFDLSLFAWIEDYYELYIEKTKIVLFHYPIFEWNGFYRNSMHLYGHIHNSAYKDQNLKNMLKKLGPNIYNVGSDLNNFTPISFDHIKKVILKGGQLNI